MALALCTLVHVGNPMKLIVVFYKSNYCEHEGGNNFILNTHNYLEKIFKSSIYLFVYIFSHFCQTYNSQSQPKVCQKKRHKSFPNIWSLNDRTTHRTDLSPCCTISALVHVESVFEGMPENANCSADRWRSQSPVNPFSICTHCFRGHTKVLYQS